MFSFKVSQDLIMQVDTNEETVFLKKSYRF